MGSNGEAVLQAKNRIGAEVSPVNKTPEQRKAELAGVLKPIQRTEATGVDLAGLEALQGMALSLGGLEVCKIDLSQPGKAYQVSKGDAAGKTRVSVGGNAYAAVPVGQINGKTVLVKASILVQW